MSFQKRLEIRRKELEEEKRKEKNNLDKKQRLIKNLTKQLRELWSNDFRYKKALNFKIELQNNKELQSALSLIWEKWEVRSGFLVFSSPVPVDIEYFLIPSIEDISYTTKRETIIDCYGEPGSSRPPIIWDFNPKAESLLNYLEWKTKLLVYQLSRGYCERYFQKNVMAYSGLKMSPDGKKQYSKNNTGTSISIHYNIHVDGKEIVYVNYHKCRNPNIECVLNYLANYALNL